MNTRSASLELPLPVDPRPAEVMKNIMAGAHGTLYGNEFLPLLRQFGAKDLGTVRFYCGSNDDIVFLKWDDGVLMIEQIYAAVQYDAEFIRHIVGFCRSPSKFLYEWYADAPTVEQLAETLL